MSHFINVLITLGTPHRFDYSPNRSEIGLWFNAYSTSDIVQKLGGFGFCLPGVFDCGLAGRTFRGAINYQTSTQGLSAVAAHSSFWNNEAVRSIWEEGFLRAWFGEQNSPDPPGGTAPIAAYVFWWQKILRIFGI